MPCHTHHTHSASRLYGSSHGSWGSPCSTLPSHKWYKCTGSPRYETSYVTSTPVSVNMSYCKFHTGGSFQGVCSLDHAFSYAQWACICTDTPSHKYHTEKASHPCDHSCVLAILCLYRTPSHKFHTKACIHSNVVSCDLRGLFSVCMNNHKYHTHDFSHLCVSSYDLSIRMPVWTYDYKCHKEMVVSHYVSPYALSELPLIQTLHHTQNMQRGVHLCESFDESASYILWRPFHKIHIYYNFYPASSSPFLYGSLFWGKSICISFFQQNHYWHFLQIWKEERLVWITQYLHQVPPFLRTPPEIFPKSHNCYEHQ